MKVITVTLYTFAELSAEAKATAIDIFVALQEESSAVEEGILDTLQAEANVLGYPDTRLSFLMTEDGTKIESDVALPAEVVSHLRDTAINFLLYVTSRDYARGILEQEDEIFLSNGLTFTQPEEPPCAIDRPS